MFLLKRKQERQYIRFKHKLSLLEMCRIHRVIITLRICFFPGWGYVYLLTKEQTNFHCDIMLLVPFCNCDECYDIIFSFLISNSGLPVSVL